MFPGMNPKKIQAAMKQMGISQNEIPANRVLIETNNKNIIINNPSVIQINMQGQETFQISGEISEEESSQEETEDTTEEDIKTIMEKCNCLEDEAKLALEKAGGDLTEAILDLS